MVGIPRGAVDVCFCFRDRSNWISRFQIPHFAQCLHNHHRAWKFVTNARFDSCYLPGILCGTYTRGSAGGFQIKYQYATHKEWHPEFKVAHESWSLPSQATHRVLGIPSTTHVRPPYYTEKSNGDPLDYSPYSEALALIPTPRSRSLKNTCPVGHSTGSC